MGIIASIGAAMFGVVCVALLAFGIFYIVGVSASQSTLTDTYGNTQSLATNSSANFVGNMTSVGTTSAAPLVLLAVVVFVCLVIFAFYIYAKGVM